MSDDRTTPTTGRCAWLDEPLTFRHAILAVATWLALDGLKTLTLIAWRLH